jgi:cysteine desulfurase
MEIYFDNAATTEPLTCGDFNFRNPSSPHGLGIRAERALIGARKEMASILGCEDSEIIFTCGGTESNNLAILGFVFAHKRQGIKIFSQPWEHPSVIEPVKVAQELGLAEHATSPVSRGLQLVSISFVSHETGDINNVSEMAKSLKKQNPDTIIHVDGVQGFCKEKLDLSNVDLFSFSGHKIHGGSGVGGLMVRKGVRIVPLLHGGEQEFSRRAGTENVASILQMTSAAKFLSESLEENHAKVAAVKAELASLTDELPNCYINSIPNAHGASPYILNMSFVGIKGETLVHLLSEKKIYASMGAACRSRKKVKSVLEAMGFSAERAGAAVRFSFSHLNTVEEAVHVKKIVIESVLQMRRVLGGRRG